MNTPRRALLALAALGALSALLGACGDGSGAPREPAVTLTREAWGALPPIGSLLSRQSPVAVTIHHTAAAQNPDRSLSEKMLRLQSFSQRPSALAGGGEKPAWGDVPYHYVIGVNGGVAEGRAPVYAGDSNTQYDLRGHIQIAVEGRFDTERPTAAQLWALERLVDEVRVRWAIPASAVAGHRARGPATLCPGRNLEVWIARYRARKGVPAP
ncbi:MAG: peptidoglycan recognition family protein [Alphaproteobacteria bacterium]